MFLWNSAQYSGSLKDYTYPANKEFGDLLLFLKRIKSNKKIHLTDVNYWQMQYPLMGYDIYIICAFGEFINEDFLNRLDRDEYFKDKSVILLTSQHWETNKLKQIKVFHLEHLHTIKRFFTKEPYLKLDRRLYTHSSLSRRTTLHKSIMTAKLLQHLDHKYTFCNAEAREYQLDELTSTLERFYPSVKLTDLEIETIKYLHANPIIESGEQWDVDSDLYTNTKLVWTLESIFLSRQNAPIAYLTEKTIKPIVSGAGFVIVGQQGSYKRLHKLGFESLIELKSDLGSDVERFNELFELINSDFSVLDSKEAQDKVDYNYNYFWGAFYSHIEFQNQEHIEAILDYINET